MQLERLEEWKTNITETFSLLCDCNSLNYVTLSKTPRNAH